MRTYDDQNVGSELSNILGLSTPIIPPATIDLIDAAASQNETITIQVSPGRDDGLEGQATGYLCTLKSEESEERSLCGDSGYSCPDCLPCTVQENEQSISLEITGVPNNQTYTLLCAIDDQDVGVSLRPSTLRTFDTLAPNVPPT